MALLTIERLVLIRKLTGADVRIYLNDDDVTMRCYVADDEVGYVGVYPSAHIGRRVDVHGNPVREVCWGVVRYVWRTPCGYVWSVVRERNGATEVSET